MRRGEPLAARLPGKSLVRRTNSLAGAIGDEAKGGFLVRQSDVAAAPAGAGQTAQERREVVRGHRHRLELAEPERPRGLRDEVGGGGAVDREAADGERDAETSLEAAGTGETL